MTGYTEIVNNYRAISCN